MIQINCVLIAFRHETDQTCDSFMQSKYHQKDSSQLFATHKALCHYERDDTSVNCFKPSTSDMGENCVLFNVDPI